MERRADQYRSVAGPARALVWILAVSCVALSVGPALAARPPDVRIMTHPMSNKINDNCATFGNLVTITRTVRNFGNDLPANQDYIYVTEITDTYTKGKGMGAHLHSSPVYIPVMPAGGPAVQVKIAVGTVESYIKKLPGPHVLLVHLVRNGVDVNAIDLVGIPIIVVRFPAGYCQPISAKKPTAPPRIFGPIGHNGIVLSRSSRSSSLLKFLLKPKLTIQYAIASSTNACDANRLLKMNVVIRNEGVVPLPAHTRSAYVHAVESGGAHLTSPRVSLPAIPARKTWRGVLVIGAEKSFFPEIPGRHTLVVSIGPGYTTPGTLAYIPPPPFRATVNFPVGYCQRSQYRRGNILRPMFRITPGTTRRAPLSPRMQLFPRMQLRLNR